MRGTRHWPLAALAAAIGLFVASPALAGSDRVTADGPLVRYSPAVPVSAQGTVKVRYDAVGDTTAVLQVTGLRPRTAYGVQARERACGRTPAAAGPRFQNVPDPEQPSHDAAFANPGNEIWLDVRTDAHGNGRSEAVLAWQFPPQRRAASVMLHAEQTNPGPLDAGSAGAALACLTVRF